MFNGSTDSVTVDSVYSFDDGAFSCDVCFIIEDVNVTISGVDVSTKHAVDSLIISDVVGLTFPFVEKSRVFVVDESTKFDVIGLTFFVVVWISCCVLNGSNESVTDNSVYSFDDSALSCDVCFIIEDVNVTISGVDVSAFSSVDSLTISDVVGLTFSFVDKSRVFVVDESTKFDVIGLTFFVVVWISCCVLNGSTDSVTDGSVYSFDDGAISCDVGFTIEVVNVTISGVDVSALSVVDSSEVKEAAVACIDGTVFVDI